MPTLRDSVSQKCFTNSPINLGTNKLTADGSYETCMQKRLGGSKFTLNHFSPLFHSYTP